MLTAAFTETEKLGYRGGRNRPKPPWTTRPLFLLAVPFLAVFYYGQSDQSVLVRKLS